MAGLLYSSPEFLSSKPVLYGNRQLLTGIRGLELTTVCKQVYGSTNLNTKTLSPLVKVRNMSAFSFMPGFLISLHFWLDGINNYTNSMI